MLSNFKLSPFQSTAIFGPNSDVGSCLVTQLLVDVGCKKLLLFCDRVSLELKYYEKVEQVSIDRDLLPHHNYQVLPKLDGISSVIAFLGSPSPLTDDAQNASAFLDATLILPFASAAKEAGVKHFFLLDAAEMPLEERKLLHAKLLKLSFKCLCVMKPPPEVWGRRSEKKDTFSSWFQWELSQPPKRKVDSVILAKAVLQQATQSALSAKRSFRPQEDFVEGDEFLQLIASVKAFDAQISKGLVSCTPTLKA
ncbi:hypothetical protein CYMTET_40884 [Cymbomonas tetramitiformis]|uniref:Uncharacterized protein n=1 Tax=Cymbomonas tetramitiformis TaxID=36881 RepID=A0AAE0C791_9CHLO|nr:hypothetical protein CYMTET_40884 [Cymbomonas tetramitiformis]